METPQPRSSDEKEEEPSQENSIQSQDPWTTDPRNPRTWSFWKKFIHTAIPCILSFEITFATSVTVPATDVIAKDFGVSRTESLLTLTLYTLGIALGPLFIAPLSEVFGRRWIYIITVTCLIAFSGGSGGAQNLATLLVCRLLAGTLGSAGIAVGAGTLADLWPLGKKGGMAGIFFILGPFLGPTLGPLAGAYIMNNHNGDWRWTQWLTVMMVAPVWIAVILSSETSRRVLDPQLKPQNTDAHGFWVRIGKIVRGAVLRPTRMLFTDIVVFSLTIYSAFTYAMIFSYFASSTYILQLNYGFDTRQVGLSFISVIIGYLCAGFVFGVFDQLIYVKACRRSPDGTCPPENRLYAGMLGSIFLPIGLFWYAWEAHRGGYWLNLVASGIPFGLGAFTLFLSTITYLVDVYQAEAAASALAANGILRYSLGATFPLFTLQMYQNVGIHGAGSIFAGISVLLLPIPWLLFKYGHVLRAKRRSTPI